MNFTELLIDDQVYKLKITCRLLKQSRGIFIWIGLDDTFGSIIFQTILLIIIPRWFLIEK